MGRYLCPIAWTHSAYVFFLLGLGVMKKILWIIVLGFLIGCSDDSSTRSKKISLGSEVYYNFCSNCHDGGMGPDLTFSTLELSEIVDKVRYGELNMPSFVHVLTEDEIGAVAYYIFQKSKK